MKRFETGDGMFYQWVMCAGVFVYGVILQLFLFAHPLGESLAGVGNNVSLAEIQLAAKPDPYSVKFYPAVMLGGALWATGNTMAVPVINAIGLGMGLLLWGCSNMLFGWASGRFINHALFPGVPADPLQAEWLNSFGVALVLVALVLYTRIKPEEQARMRVFTPEHRHTETDCSRHTLTHLHTPRTRCGYGDAVRPRAAGGRRGARLQPSHSHHVTSATSLPPSHSCHAALRSRPARVRSEHSPHCASCAVV